MSVKHVPVVEAGGAAPAGKRRSRHSRHSRRPLTIIAPLGPDTFTGAGGTTNKTLSGGVGACHVWPHVATCREVPAPGRRGPAERPLPHYGQDAHFHCRDYRRSDRDPMFHSRLSAD